MPRENNAFDLYATESPYTTRTLRGKLNLRIGELAGEVANGLCLDWAHYKTRIGVIQGLKEAIEILDEIEEEGK